MTITIKFFGVTLLSRSIQNSSCHKLNLTKPGAYPIKHTYKPSILVNLVYIRQIKDIQDTVHSQETTA